MPRCVVSNSLGGFRFLAWQRGGAQVHAIGGYLLPDVCTWASSATSSVTSNFPPRENGPRKHGRRYSAWCGRVYVIVNNELLSKAMYVGYTLT